MAKDLGTTPAAAAQGQAARPMTPQQQQAMLLAQQKAMAARAAQLQQPAQPANEEVEEAEEVEEEEGGVSKTFMFNTMPSFIISAVVHGIFVIALALWPHPTNEKQEAFQVVSKPAEELEEIQDFKDTLNDQPLNVNASPTESVTALSSDLVIDTDISNASDLDAAPTSMELSDISNETAPRSDLTKQIGAFSGTGVQGRGAASRKAMLAAGGGNEKSELAVAMALKWFAEHQNPDGSWGFDHNAGPCQGRCKDPGNLVAGRSGATGLALLPFLGAGQTHKEGAYKEKVKGGLSYLISAMKPNGKNGGTLADGGTMYSHGICSIALCEAYAMTKDKELLVPAQAALSHIVYAQDPVGGGWRYAPREPGDTSAVGWQLMALKSGHMAYLQVPPNTINGAIRFLDSVQAEGGAKYGYTGPGAGPATTAIGLLSRMYLGWKKDNPALLRGVEYLSKAGPMGPKNPANMYFNYYATQVLRHHDGEEWQKWNVVLRDWLIEKQDKTGHQHGSWHFDSKADHGIDRGGRHYCTAMSTMILEVYYRHMPIYKKSAGDDDFKL